MGKWRPKAASQGETRGDRGHDETEQFAQTKKGGSGGKTAVTSYKLALLEGLSVPSSRSASPPLSPVARPTDAGPEDLVEILRELYEQDRQPSEANLLHALEVRTGRDWRREELMYLFDQPVYFGGSDTAKPRPPRRERPGRPRRRRPPLHKGAQNDASGAWWDEWSDQAQACVERLDHSRDAWWADSGDQEWMDPSQDVWWDESGYQAEHVPGIGRNGQHADWEADRSSARRHQAEQAPVVSRTGRDVEQRPKARPARWHQAPKLEDGDTESQPPAVQAVPRQPDFSQAPLVSQNQPALGRLPDFRHAPPPASQTQAGMARQPAFSQTPAPTQAQFGIERRQPGYNQPAVPSQTQAVQGQNSGALSWLPNGVFPQQAWPYPNQGQMAPMPQSSSHATASCSQGQMAPMQQSSSHATAACSQGQMAPMPQGSPHATAACSQGQMAPMPQSSPQATAACSQGQMVPMPQSSTHAAAACSQGQLTPMLQNSPASAAYMYQQPNAMGVNSPATSTAYTLFKPNATDMNNQPNANQMMQQQVWVVPYEDGYSGNGYSNNGYSNSCYPNNNPQAPAVFFAVA